jgi:hypothetical protein
LISESVSIEALSSNGNSDIVLPVTIDVSCQFRSRITAATPATPGYDYGSGGMPHVPSLVTVTPNDADSSGHLFCAGLMYCIWADPTQNKVIPVLEKSPAP